MRVRARATNSGSRATRRKRHADDFPRRRPRAAVVPSAACASSEAPNARSRWRSPCARNAQTPGAADHFAKNTGGRFHVRAAGSPRSPRDAGGIRARPFQVTVWRFPSMIGRGGRGSRRQLAVPAPGSARLMSAACAFEQDDGTRDRRGAARSTRLRAVIVERTSIWIHVLLPTTVENLHRGIRLNPTPNGHFPAHCCSKRLF
jgi:hypothetical protein